MEQFLARCSSLDDFQRSMGDLTGSAYVSPLRGRQEVPRIALGMTREVAVETYEALLERFGKKEDLFYLININNGTCSCPDRCRRHMVC